MKININSDRNDPIIESSHLRQHAAVGSQAQSLLRVDLYTVNSGGTDERLGPGQSPALPVQRKQGHLGGVAPFLQELEPDPPAVEQRNIFKHHLVQDHSHRPQVYLRLVEAFLLTQ